MDESLNRAAYEELIGRLRQRFPGLVSISAAPRIVLIRRGGLTYAGQDKDVGLTPPSGSLPEGSGICLIGKRDVDDQLGTYIKTRVFSLYQVTSAEIMKRCILKLIFTTVLVISACLGIYGQGNGSISGVLVDLNGAPQANVTVRAETSAGQVIRSASTDDKGYYRIENVPPGNYVVSGGLPSRPTYFPGRAAKGDASTVSVRAGVEVVATDFRMATPLGIRVSGRVTVPAGGQLPATTVLVPPSPALLGAPLTTAINPDGTFQFNNIPPGTYTVRVVPFAPLPPSSPGLPRQPDFPTVVVDKTDVTNVSIAIPVQFDFPVRFTIDAGDPLPSNNVQVAAKYGTGTRYSLRLPNGDSNLVLPLGQYAISLEGLPPNYSLQSIIYGTADLLKSPLQANAIPTSEILVTIALFPPKSGAAAKVRGSVTNLPPPSYLYNPQIHLARALAEGGGVLDAPMNNDGTFEIPRVPPGKYTLNTSGMASSLQFPISVTSADILEVAVALTGIANPFPEYPGASFAGNFASTQITLQGVITQEITSIRPPAPVMYFRMEVPDSKTGRLINWAVMLTASGYRSPADIPDIGKLKVGTHITIQANPARDGANRASLVRGPNANTSMGIKVD